MPKEVGETMYELRLPALFILLAAIAILALATPALTSL